MVHDLEQEVTHHADTSPCCLSPLPVLVCGHTFFFSSQMDIFFFFFLNKHPVFKPCLLHHIHPAFSIQYFCHQRSSFFHEKKKIIASLAVLCRIEWLYTIICNANLLLLCITHLFFFPPNAMNYTTANGFAHPLFSFLRIAFLHPEMTIASWHASFSC